MLDVEGGARTEVSWDRRRRSSTSRGSAWATGSPLTLQVMTRDQRTLRTLVAADDGTTSTIADDSRSGLGRARRRLAGAARGRRASCAPPIAGDARGVVVGEDRVTPPTLHVDHIVATGADEVVVGGWTGDPTAAQVARVTRSGDVTVLTDPTATTTRPATSRPSS